MALQIRRGLQANLPASPAEGELLYATDTNKLYVGDGGVPQEISGGGLANIVEDITPQLGGELDVNGFRISSVNNGDVRIHPDGNGLVVLHGILNIDNFGHISKNGSITLLSSTFTTFGSNETLNDGNIRIIRNTHSTATSQGFTFEQHHNVVDAVNFNFVRTRGTGLVQESVINGDELADLSFIGHDGTNRVTAAVMTAKVGGPVSLGIVPGEFSFNTRNLANVLGERAKLTSEGVWKVNSIENYSGSSLTLTATDIIMAGNTKLNAQGDLRFADADSSNWVAFQAPATIGANITWTLPAADGTSGQVLSTNGSGTLSWATASGGTGLVSRIIVSETTGILPNGITDNIVITGAKGYILYKVETNVAAWVRIYTSVAARTADSSRAEGVDPIPGAGVIAEVITTGAATIVMSPGVIGFNNETSPSSAIALAVTNKNGGASVVVVTLTILQIEA